MNNTLTQAVFLSVVAGTMLISILSTINLNLMTSRPLKPCILLTSSGLTLTLIKLGSGIL